MRFVLGANFGVSLAAAPGPDAGPPAPAGTGKADAAVAVVRVDATARTVTVAIPPYDLESHNRLEVVRVYLVPNLTQPPDTADGYAASAHPFSEANVGAVQGGGEADVEFPAGLFGDFFGQIVLGFDA